MRLYAVFFIFALLHFRYNSAVRQTQQPGINMVTASAKVDTVKDELEETSNRVDQAKVSTELLHLNNDV